MLVFIHIPKCGGTTLNSILASAYGRRKVLHAGGYQEVREFVRAPAESIKGYKVVGGHLYVQRFLEKGLSSADFVCLIRDPIERFESFYRDVSTREHPLQSQAEHGPEAFLEYLLADKVQARHLHQCSWFCGENSYEKAWEVINSHHFHIADLTFFDAFYEHLSNAFSWRKTSWEKKNVKGHAKQSQLRPEFALRLEELFHNDYRLRESILGLHQFQSNPQAVPSLFNKENC